MNATELCPPPHLECADLNGRDCVVTISDVGFGIVGEDEVKKGVIHFREFPRAMVVNRTNLKRIITLHGTETDDWTGKRITLYPSETDYAGKTVPCIRVRPEVPATPSATEAGQ